MQQGGGRLSDVLNGGERKCSHLLENGGAILESLLASRATLQNKDALRPQKGQQMGSKEEGEWWGGGEVGGGSNLFEVSGGVFEGLLASGARRVGILLDLEEEHRLRERGDAVSNHRGSGRRSHRNRLVITSRGHAKEMGKGNGKWRAGRGGGETFLPWQGDTWFLMCSPECRRGRGVQGEGARMKGGAPGSAKGRGGARKWSRGSWQSPVPRRTRPRTSPQPVPRVKG